MKNWQKNRNYLATLPLQPQNHRPMYDRMGLSHGKRAYEQRHQQPQPHNRFL